MWQTPLSSAKFSLNVGGVAGFFGGDEAVSAMATIYMSRGRKWLGWYNSPGSYVVAKTYGKLANSKFWHGIFPGVKEEPTVVFGLGGMGGPEYLAAQSKTRSIRNTGHVGYLIMKECEDLHVATRATGRQVTPTEVTIINLKHIPEVIFKLRPPTGYTVSALALIPILVSICSCVLCGIFHDWYCCTMIIVGILATQYSYLAIGSGSVHFTHPRTSHNAPAGDGMLKDNRQVSIVLGAEGAVNAITRGRFWVRLPDEPECNSIGHASLLLIAQFLLQLLLIPQGTLFGQILFLGTFAVSWVYNALCLSADNETAQREILMSQVLRKPSMVKYRFGTKTALATFVLLVVKPVKPMDLLNELLPEDTHVYRIWKETIAAQIGKEEFFFDKDRFEELVESSEIIELQNFSKDANDAREAFEKYKGDEVFRGPGNGEDTMV